MNLQTSTPVTFVYVTDRARALAFYVETLGFTHVRSNPHGDYIDMGKSLLHTTVMADHKAGPHPVAGWDVADIAATAAALKEQGVAMTVFEGFGQDDMGIWTAPEGLPKLAWFPDPDGNFLQLSQMA